MVFDFILVARSKYEENEVQWEIPIFSPDEQSTENARMISLFSLVRSTYDVLRFNTIDGVIVFAPKSVPDAGWTSSVGDILEKYFQEELHKIFHGDWDSFSLAWYPSEYLEFMQS